MGMVLVIKCFESVNNKKHAPYVIFFNEKKVKKIFGMTLKSEIGTFSFAEFRTYVDLPKTYSPLK